MEEDVVCGMQVDPAKTAGSSEYNGKTYYFCSKAARRSSTPIPLSTPNRATCVTRLEARNDTSRSRPSCISRACRGP